MASGPTGDGQWWQPERLRGRLRLLAMTLAMSATSAFAAGEQARPEQDAASDAAASEAPAPAPAAVPVEPDYSLEAVLSLLAAEQARSDAGLAEREARYAQRLQEAQQRLADAQKTLAETEAEGRRLDARFDSNRVELDDKTRLLKDKIGALKELFGVFQQNASDLIGAFNGSPTSLQYPDRDTWLEGFANRMKDASEVSSADDIRTLWYEMLREISARGEIVRLLAPVYSPTGAVEEREVIRLGGFHLVSAEPEAEYLRWRAGQQRVETLPRQPSGPYAEEIASYAGAAQGVHALSVDPTGGILMALLAEKPTTDERVDQGGLVGYMILGLGAMAFLLALVKLLDISVISLRVAAQRRRLDAPHANNSLGRMVLTYRQYGHLDAETLEMRLHERISKESARIQKFTIFLAIIAAVAPLMGLLGTVVGMINTFQAITLYGTGDPQTMAGGISQALITTVLGLVVAVPAVLLHAVVSARGRAVINVLKQQSALLLGDRLASQYQEGEPGPAAAGSDHLPQPA